MTIDITIHTTDFFLFGGIGILAFAAWIIIQTWYNENYTLAFYDTKYDYFTGILLVVTGIILLVMGLNIFNVIIK